MNNIAIKVENLGKRYFIRHEKKESYETFQDVLIDGGGGRLSIRYRLPSRNRLEKWGSEMIKNNGLLPGSKVAKIYEAKTKDIEVLMRKSVQEEEIFFTHRVIQNFDMFKKYQMPFLLNSLSKNLIIRSREREVLCLRFVRGDD